MTFADLPEIQSTFALAATAAANAQEKAAVDLLALEVIHELRNPLEALGHLTYLTFEAAKDPDEVRRYLSLAQEQIVTLGHIIDQTLGDAKTSPAQTTTDLVLIADAALRIHERALWPGLVQVIRDFPNAPLTTAYTGNILQVLSHLIANALGTMAMGGILKIRLRRLSSGIYLLVSDRGHGVPNAYSRDIFQLFFKTKEDKRTGLGLALTQDCSVPWREDLYAQQHESRAKRHTFSSEIAFVGGSIHLSTRTNE